MTKIKVLQPELYNIISAGEVIERPVGAVKELVENSIDAGATHINIEVVGGGMEYICITDDGEGIEEQDLELAFVKHATSKISNATDLYAVETLGFRGEALPSIAAISRVKLTSRTRQADAGACITVEDGVIVGKEYTACNIGTKIEVRGLFHNIPVQKNFFKSLRGETAEITKFISRIILANPNLSFTYTLDGKRIFSTNGDGIREAIFAVYGADCLSHCLEVSWHNSENIRIYGYVGDPKYAKPNKNYQTLSVNGRYVENQTLNAVIMQACKQYFMQRQFPFYVIDIALPYSDVNVNVHPKKMEVRFSNLEKICSGIYHAVLDALQKYAVSELNEIVPAQPPQQQTISSEEQQDLLRRINESMNELEPMNPDQEVDVQAMEDATALEEYRSSFAAVADEIEREVTVERARIALGLDNPDNLKSSMLVIEPEKETPTLTEADLLLFRTRILGVAFKTYLILELDDKVILVDQHAAHERILYDKFMARQTGDMQQVLVPYVFTVKDEEAIFIEDNIDNILSAGIQIESFGHNTYRIVAVSTLLADTEMKDFVQFLLGSMDEYRVDDRTLIVEKIAKKACKAAVKAGYRLNEYEIKYIIQEVYANKIVQCPHGRPITVVLSKKDIEKMFKRIV